jgi:hypothetical protein
LWDLEDRAACVDSTLRITRLLDNFRKADSPIGCCSGLLTALIYHSRSRHFSLVPLEVIRCFPTARLSRSGEGDFTSEHSPVPRRPRLFLPEG